MKSRKIMALSLAIALAAIVTPLRASTTCVMAPMQLQQYIVQVNQTANAWYYQGIPQRCGYNQYCQSALLQQLNAWYQQQTAIVNGWYYQIAAACTDKTDLDRHRFSDSRPGDDAMDKDATEDLHVDKNENKTVAIVIPDNPSGFNGH
jgi:hypothetical protein